MQNASADRALVASIHDVSPATRAATERILGDLRAIGCEKTSLLVVPDHHRRGRISEDAVFGEWLRERVREGHEAVLHGYYHLREPRGGEGIWKKLVTRSYTAGEGEFYDLERMEAARRLTEGLREFAAMGLRPEGFIAPAWLLGAEAEEAVREAGFGYTTRIATVLDFSNGGRVYRSRSLVWSVRAGWRRVCSLAWNAALFSSLKKSSLMRIGIHPPDWDHESIRTQILKLCRAALVEREPMTYQRWLLRQRANR
jgi:predicted deacetylase